VAYLSASPGMMRTQVRPVQRHDAYPAKGNQQTQTGAGNADQRVERTAVAFEKAAVLFCLAASLSADAAAADLGTDAGCKRAARRYQVP
jgi:hypothetical protein